MDGWILGAMWSACPLLDLVSRAACQNDHTWCPSIRFCLSTQSLHPVLREPITPLHTQTHFVAHIHTKEGWATEQIRKLSILSVSQCSLLLKLSLNFPPNSSCFLLCFSHKDLLHSVTCIYLREESSGGRYRKHLGPTCRTFLPAGIFHIRAQTSALFWRLTEITQVWRR